MRELDGFSVLLVDDHPLFREGLALALRQRAPALDVHAVASLEQALQALHLEPDRFDLAVLDYRLPGENGLQCAARLRTAFPGVACALMSGTDDAALPDKARASGLVGYFPKSLEIGSLLEGLRCLAMGETYFLQGAGLAPAVAANTMLTARQAEIVRLAAQGASNKEIAQALGIAPHTVKNHLAQIFERLGASNRAQAVALAREIQP
jgi:two-component system, NarL family, nitrate/nitrite response regulator NarL